MAGEARDTSLLPRTIPVRPWSEKYVGLPFVDGGRDWRGVDCWGLVKLILQYEKGIHVPSYGEISACELLKVAEMVSDETKKEPWNPVIHAQEFDVAVMHKRHAPIHVGVMADRTHLLHVELKTSAVLIDIKHPTVSFRSIEYYRHRNLINDAAA